MIQPAKFNGRVAVIGLGYIGLPTAAALAAQGVEVVGVDVNEQTVAAVNRGEVPFVEPDLAEVVDQAVARGRLTASTTIPTADAFLIAVPTPYLEDHTADMSYVRAATESIAPVLRGGEVVVLESTSPPGSSLQVSTWLAQLRPDLTAPHGDAQQPDFHVAHCPERVLPGRIMIEMVANDRVVGGITPECAAKAAAIYRVFSNGRIMETDAASAEMAKLVENSYRDVNIAFANELSLVCEKLGLDVWEVIELANHHPRVNILSPGPGVGGHCIAVDPWFIVGAAPETARLIRTAREVNDSKPHHVVQQTLALAERFREPRIACLGLAFKANVDDLRESPAVEIVEQIASSLTEGEILVVEPFVTQLPGSLADTPASVRLASAEQALAEADIVVLLVDHDLFREIDPALLLDKAVVDTRGFWR